MATILVSHDFGVIAQACDVVAVMYAGYIVERAPVREIYTHPHHPYTQGLLETIPRYSSRPRGTAPLEDDPRTASGPRGRCLRDVRSLPAVPTPVPNART